MKSEQNQGYIVRLWQILPECFRKIFRTIRSQWHGDIYDKLDYNGQALEADKFTAISDDTDDQTGLLKKLEKQTFMLIKQLNEQAVALKKLEEQSTNQMNTATKWHQAHLRNQISLANKRPGGRTLYTPWSPRKTFNLVMLENGHLGFYPSAKSPAIPSGILVNSMSKAGTHFVGTILDQLGFKGTTAFGYLEWYEDATGVAPEYKQYVNPLKCVDLPFDIQAGLIQPGHYILAHIYNNESITKAWRHGMNKVLIAIRDLRYVIVSAMRHVMKTSFEYQPLSAFTSEDLCNFILTSKEAPVNVYLMQARSCMDSYRNGYGHLVRYEELISHDKEKMLPSLRSISEVTDCSVDDVFKAVEAKNGAKTATFSGDHVSLDRIWTQKVEELFIAMGGDVLNEKLGYPREYFPKN